MFSDVVSGIISLDARAHAGAALPHDAHARAGAASPPRTLVYVVAEWQPLAHDLDVVTVWRQPDSKEFARNVHHVSQGWSSSWQVRCMHVNVRIHVAESMLPNH